MAILIKITKKSKYLTICLFWRQLPKNNVWKMPCAMSCQALNKFRIQ